MWHFLSFSTMLIKPHKRREVLRGCLLISRKKVMKKTIAILMGTAFLFTTNVFAAELMTRAEFKKVESHYKKIGTVSTSNEVSVDDAKKELIEKADKKGADVLVLTSGNTNNKIHGTANIYKKK
jgi:flavin-binding protein dodecin